MNINEEYAIELLLAGHLKGMPIGEGYIVAFVYECKITNPERLDNWLLVNGFLRKPTIFESIYRYKVPEIKDFLSRKGMKTTGNKRELVERLASGLSKNEIAFFLDSDKRYFLSEKGEKHYYENIDLEYLHKNWKYRIQLSEYFKFRKKNGREIGFYEAAYSALKERIKNGTTDISNSLHITSFDFFNFSEICEKLELNEDAIKSMLIKLYLDTNLIENNTFLFDKDMIEFNGIESMCQRLDQNMIFNVYTTQRIVGLSEYFSSYMIDDIYENIKIRYTVFEKNNFKNAVEDMINSSYFEPLPYMKIIKENYRRIANKILKDKNSVGFLKIKRFLSGLK